MRDRMELSKTKLYQELEPLREAAKTWIQSLMRNMGVNKYEARSRYYQMVNATIKYITGAQMSEHEARRIMKQLPQWESYPEVFMRTWDSIMETREKKWLNSIGSYYRGGWRGISGLMRPFHEMSADPYKRTPWATDEHLKARLDAAKARRGKKPKKKSSGPRIIERHGVKFKVVGNKYIRMD